MKTTLCSIILLCFSLSAIAQHNSWSIQYFKSVKKTDKIPLNGERNSQLTFDFLPNGELKATFSLMTEMEEGEPLNSHFLITDQAYTSIYPDAQDQSIRIHEIQEVVSSNEDNPQNDEYLPYPNSGTSTQATPQHNTGMSTQHNTDGTITTTVRNGNISTQHHSDGTISTINHHGNISTQMNSDGTSSTIHHHGNVSTQMNSNGTSSTTHHHGNVSTQMNSDGTSSTIHHHGNTSTQTNNNGTISTTHHNTVHHQQPSTYNNPQRYSNPVIYETISIKRNYTELFFTLNKEQIQQIVDADEVGFNFLFANQKILILLKKSQVKKLKRKL